MRAILQVKMPRKHGSMGILDMYGFERTSTNHEVNGDFEQLIINFANEKIQQVRFMNCRLHSPRFYYTYLLCMSTYKHEFLKFNR